MFIFFTLSFLPLVYFNISCYKPDYGCAGSEKIENAGPGPDLKFQISRVRVLTFENRGSGSKELKTPGSGSNVKISSFN